MHLPAELRSAIEQQTETTITVFRPASGGCINHVGEIKTIEGKTFFIKWNDAQKFPDMFVAEQRGLQLLSSTRTVRVPEVIQTFVRHPWQVIVMEYVGRAYPCGNYWELLGCQLAALHRHTAPSFGLDTNNYIGSLPQNNERNNSWVDFFITNRLEVQLRLAEQQIKIGAGIRKRFEKMYNLLADLFPPAQPSLLHGDLWSGNLMTDENGKPCVIDPAVYYGHREAELAFTRLFGGFDERFYQSY